MSLRRILALLTPLLLMAACSSTKEPAPAAVEIQQIRVATEQSNGVPGTKRKAWIEPMHDTIRVPSKLDPTGTYYRPAHNTVVEIRHHKFQEVQFPTDSKLEKQGNQ